MECLVQATKRISIFTIQLCVITSLLCISIVVHKLYYVSKQALYTYDILTLEGENGIFMTAIQNELDREGICISSNKIVSIWDSSGTASSNGLCSDFCVFTNNHGDADVGLFYAPEDNNTDVNLSVHIFRDQKLHPRLTVSSPSWHSDIPFTVIPEYFYERLETVGSPPEVNFNVMKTVALVTSNCSIVDLLETFHRQTIDCYSWTEIPLNYRVVMMLDESIKEYFFEIMLKNNVIVVNEPSFAIYVSQNSYVEYEDLLDNNLLLDELLSNYTMWEGYLNNRRKSMNELTARLNAMSIYSTNYMCRICNYYCKISLSW